MTVRRDFDRRAALRLRAKEACIVMVCADMCQADIVGRQLSEVNSAYLVTYRRVEDLVCNAPTGRVALVILDTRGNPTDLARTLKWIGHRWPRCPVTVVGATGGGEEELAARTGGAFFLTRPVAPQQWADLFESILAGPAAPHPPGAAEWTGNGQFRVGND